MMLRCCTPAVLPVLLLLSSGTLTAQSASCLAVGVGAWSPRNPGPIWTGSRTITLKRGTVNDFDGIGGRKGWREVVLGDGKSSSEYERGWAWIAPTKDSLMLVRPAMLSEGIWFVGRWRADTLTGRAHAFSDATGPGSPRANAFGIRYQCGAAQGAADALSALAALQRSDVPDPALGAVEDSTYQVEIRQRVRESNQSK